MDQRSTAATRLLLPSSEHLQAARSQLLSTLPEVGLGCEATNHHLEDNIAPALSLSSQSSKYYGFVTGGATPAAIFADHLAVDYDQNVQVHLPMETVATNVEDCALQMLCQLIQLDPSQFRHRTFTTGATASNVIGLALGRQFVIEHASRMSPNGLVNVAEIGLFAATRSAGIESIQILTTVAHSSLRKAASIVGLGRTAVVDVSRRDAPHKFDFTALAARLATSSTASIVAVSCAEVNTGFFATDKSELTKIRALCDKYGAWLHIDGAFGLLARTLPRTAEYQHLLEGVAGLEHADSVTGDAHKLINVPYDCGFFLSRNVSRATEVFQNPNAAYLSSSAMAEIPSPLNIGLENSRRFRALPVYATLVAYGSQGYSDMMQRQIQLARAIAAFILDTPEYELLPAQHDGPKQDVLETIYMVVLFRARDDALNKRLVSSINNTRKIYVSGTAWNGTAAARFAVANWRADVSLDLSVVKEVLQSIL